jgi:N-methylhydantoinase B
MPTEVRPLLQAGAPAAPEINPITTEVIRHALIAAADEMQISLVRTAHNPVIYELMDLSCGVLDAECRMVAQADGLPIFLGNLAAAISTVVDDVGRDALRPGDLYLINDPYDTGPHLNDVTTVCPVFHECELVAFTSTRAHWLDIGAKDPGGSLDGTDIVQEGLFFRSVKLYDAGRLNAGVWRIIEYNVRFSRNMLGDLRAQVAAARTGEQRVREIFARHGRATVKAAISVILRQGEQRARSAVAAIADGQYTAESCVDDDGLGNGPLKLKVTVTVRDESFEVDLTGSSPQTPGPYNIGAPHAVSAARIALKALTHPTIPATEHDFVPLEVTVPEECFLHAHYPAPVFLGAVPLFVLVDLVCRALAEALPDRVPAGHFGDLAGFYFVGTDPVTERLYMHQEPEVGGWGAAFRRDGEPASIGILSGATRNAPAEVIESRFPLRLERHALREDSGGSGEFRGGLGIYRDYRVLGHTAEMTCIMNRETCPAWGLFGGEPALDSRVVIAPGTPEEVICRREMRVPIRDGVVVSIQTGGGGGWGDPLNRDPARVRNDLQAGYVSQKTAYDSYGVANDPLTLTVDAPATQRRRADLRAASARVDDN